VPLCLELGIAYVPFGPLAGGWLTGKYRRGEPFPERSRMSQRPASYERYHDDRVFDGLDRLRKEAERRGVDMPTLAFAWVLARVDGAVCGPMRAEHLEPVLAARELELSRDEVQRIGGLLDDPTATPMTRPESNRLT
jgi:aryl-alcohol dehydrogenase-like predicted oxidoreductase